jgi:hypothetical protein
LHTALGGQGYWKTYACFRNEEDSSEAPFGYDGMLNEIMDFTSFRKNGRVRATD